MRDEVRPDATVHYQTDGTGARVGLIPATCKLRIHSLHVVGYTATESGGTLRVSCNACTAKPDPDHSWVLRTQPPTPDRAELDDSPYRTISPRLIAQRVRVQNYSHTAGMVSIDHPFPTGHSQGVTPRTNVE